MERRNKEDWCGLRKGDGGQGQEKFSFGHSDFEASMLCQVKIYYVLKFNFNFS